MDGPFLLLYGLLTPALVLLSMGFVRRYFPGHLAERLAVAWATSLALIVLETFTLGLFWNGYTGRNLALLEVLMIGGLAPWLARDGWREARDAARAAADVLTRPLRPLVFLSAAAALLAWGAAFAFAWESPVPGLDAVAYHLPIAVYLNQEAGLEWYATRSGHVNEFPKNAHFAFARIFAHGGDERAIRPLQWAWGFFAVLALYAAMRNLRLCRATAGVLAPAFLLAPAVLAQPMVLWGTIDLVFHILLILVYTTVLWLPPDERGALRRALFAALIASLAIGTKSQGLLLAGVPILYLAIRLAVSFPTRRTHVLKTFLAHAALILLLVGSYTYIQNIAWFGNPFQPIRIKAFGTVLLDGAFKSVHDLVGTEEATGTRSNPFAVLRSWSVLLARHWVYDDLRVGGWGFLWMFGLLPGMLAGIAIASCHRRGWLAILGGVVVLLMFVVPGSWWSRFSLYLFGLALVYTGIALEAVPRPRWRSAVAAVLLALATGNALESYRAYRRHNIPSGLAPAPGWFLHSLDGYRVRHFWEDPEDRAAYLWVRNNLPPGTTLVYFHGYWAGIYPYYFYRHDLHNRTYAYGEPTTERQFLAHLRAHEADYFLVQNYQDAAAWAPRQGDLLFDGGKFLIYNARSAR